MLDYTDYTFDEYLFDEGWRYFVVLDGRRRYGLWPDFAEMPSGCRIVFGPAPMEDCDAYVETAQTTGSDLGGEDTPVAVSG